MATVLKMLMKYVTKRPVTRATVVKVEEVSKTSNPCSEDTVGEEGSDTGVDIQEFTDAVIFKELHSDSWSHSYDLIGGLVKFEQYLFERLPSEPEVEEGLQLILTHLESLAERSPHGATWRRPARLLSQEQRQLTPEGNYNLGVAHGVAGAIHF